MSKKCNFLKALFFVAAFMLVLPIAAIATGGTGVDSIPYDLTKVWRTNATVAQAQAIFTFKGPDGKIYQPVCVQAGNEVEIRMPNGFTPGKWVLMQYGIENRPFTVEKQTPEQWLANEIKRAQLYIGAGDGFEWHSSTFPDNLIADVSKKFTNKNDAELAKAEIMMKAKAEYESSRGNYDKALEISTEAIKIVNKIDPARVLEYVDIVENLQKADGDRDAVHKNILAAQKEIQDLLDEQTKLLTEQSKLVDAFLKTKMTDEDLEKFKSAYEDVGKRVDALMKKIDDSVAKLEAAKKDAQNMNFGKEQLEAQKKAQTTTEAKLQRRSNLLAETGKKYADSLLQYDQKPDGIRKQIDKLAGIHKEIESLMSELEKLGKIAKPSSAEYARAALLRVKIVQLFQDEAKVYTALFDNTLGQPEKWLLNPESRELIPVLKQVIASRPKLALEGIKAVRAHVEEQFVTVKAKRNDTIIRDKIVEVITKVEGSKPSTVYVNLMYGEVLDRLKEKHKLSDYCKDASPVSTPKWTTEVLQEIFGEMGYQFDSKGNVVTGESVDSGAGESDGKQDTSGDSSRATP